MNMSHDILLVEDSQKDIDLALYALREANLANSILVVRDGKEALDFLFVAAFLPKGVSIIPPDSSCWI
jgi:CheY-like chemotaxis protein